MYALKVSHLRSQARHTCSQVPLEERVDPRSQFHGWCRTRPRNTQSVIRLSICDSTVSCPPTHQTRAGFSKFSRGGSDWESEK
jgi:hypothetical protein